MPLVINLVSRVRLIVVLCFSLYVGIYIYGSNSQAYDFSKTWLSQSESVRAAVGEIKSYRLSPWGGFREHFAGDKTRASLDIQVTGSRGLITVHLDLLKSDSVWIVVSSKII